jgi:dihydroxyacetone kinase-like protein
MESLTGKDIRGVIEVMRKIVQEKKQELIELDAAAGDGDLGLSMTAAFETAARELPGIQEPNVNRLLMRIGMVIAKGAPSTLGTLIATGFMRGGKSMEDTTAMGTDELSTFFDGFVQGIMDRGKAKPGEKTIVDSIHPAARALQAAAGEKRSLQDAVSLALEAARKGVEETRKMKAEHGRAAYYGEKSIGRQDPGATVGMLLFKAFDDYVNAGG